MQTRSFDLKEFFRETPVTATLAALNIIVYIVEIFLDLFTDISLFQLGAIEQTLVIEFGEYYRVITAGFLHSGLIHLFFNVGFGIVYLTRVFEKGMGSGKTIMIYSLSMLLSGFIVVAFTPAGIGTVGASGAIFGILGSLLWLTVFRKDLIHPQFARQIRSIILLNVAITLFMSNISIPGHFGGLVAGFLLSFLIIPRDKSEYEIYH